MLFFRAAVIHETQRILETLHRASPSRQSHGMSTLSQANQFTLGTLRVLWRGYSACAISAGAVRRNTPHNLTHRCDRGAGSRAKCRLAPDGNTGRPVCRVCARH
jgi:hypothetical protein